MGTSIWAAAAGLTGIGTNGYEHCEYTPGGFVVRAVQIVQHGEPAALRDIETPAPRPDEVRLRVLTAGVNFADLLLADGTYQEKPAPPFTLGLEVCGIVDAAGSDASPVSSGSRVAAFTGRGGGMAEYCCVPAANCVPVPDSMPSEIAAGFLIVYLTSQLALVRRARLQSGERLLVLGAGGGVGLTAVEIGSLLGAEVIAAARGAAKLDAARRAGAGHLIDTDTDDLREKAKALGGADVVYDPVGGDLFKAAMRSANPEAWLLSIGFASGSVPQIPANILLVKNLNVAGVYMGGYSRFNPAVLTDSASTLVRWYREGRIRPVIGGEVELERADAAFDMLRRRQAVGKLVVRIAPG